MAVHRCTKAAVGPPCLQRLLASPGKMHMQYIKLRIYKTFSFVRSVKFQLASVLLLASWTELQEFRASVLISQIAGFPRELSAVS